LISKLFFCSVVGDDEIGDLPEKKKKRKFGGKLKGLVGLKSKNKKEVVERERSGTMMPGDYSQSVRMGGQ